MSFANNTPASEICLLSGLLDKKSDAKVRFLGCVASYDAATGVLTLEQPMTGTPTRVKALVSINMILDRITAEQVATGAWVNVIGRIEISTHEMQMHPPRSTDAQCVRVQALLLWSTGPIDFRAYESEVTGLLREDGGSRVPDQAMIDG